LRSIRYAIVGGEPMPMPLITTWQSKGISIRQGYGLTEFGPNVFSLNEDDSLRKIGSIGFPNFYIQTRVVNEQGLDIKTPDTVGELLLRGPMCMPSYWNNSEATAETIRSGWLHTGDLVRFDHDGYFYVAGRKKDMFISGGENVYPAEVEQILRRHPAVREAAVIGISHNKWGEVGRAFVSLKDHAVTTEDEILRYCTGHLAKFKIPKSVVFLPELPKGESGKILKRALLQSATTF
jgi:fatty-acyl-CoA synthase